MNKTGKLIFTILLTLALAFTMLACTAEDDVDYANVEDITVDETSIADGFLVTEFDISKVLLNVKYYGRQHGFYRSRKNGSDTGDDEYGQSFGQSQTKRPGHSYRHPYLSQVYHFFRAGAQRFFSGKL